MENKIDPKVSELALRILARHDQADLTLSFLESALSALFAQCKSISKSNDDLNQL